MASLGSPVTETVFGAQQQPLEYRVAGDPRLPKPVDGERCEWGNFHLRKAYRVPTLEGGLLCLLGA